MNVLRNFLEVEVLTLAIDVQLPCGPLIYIVIAYQEIFVCTNKSQFSIIVFRKEKWFKHRVHRVFQRGSCRTIHLGLDLFGLFQKTATLGDGYDQRNKDDKPFSFTEKETFSGVTILSASKVHQFLCVHENFALF